MPNTIMQTGFDTRPIRMEPLWLVAFHAPREDVDRVFDEIVKSVPLIHGKTDSNAYRAPDGLEYYRPLEGTPTGAEDDIRKRPNVDELRFFIPRDTGILDQVIEAIYEVHSYYEPVITVQDILRSTCKGLDDKANPHRWWNKDGDWKQVDD
ncbi:MAG: hypothetical protein ABJ246_07405 [Paracoccaceae bacterium]